MNRIRVIVRNNTKEALLKDIRLMEIDGWTVLGEIEEVVDHRNHSDWTRFVFEADMFKDL